MKQGEVFIYTLDHIANLVDVALCGSIHTLSNAGGKQLVIRNSQRLLSKAQQVIGGFTGAMYYDLEQE